jgi:hypothetical protein
VEEPGDLNCGGREDTESLSNTNAVIPNSF